MTEQHLSTQEVCLFLGISLSIAIAKEGFSSPLSLLWVDIEDFLFKN